MPFCDDHSEVMRCLGALEKGQEDMHGLLHGIDTKIGELFKGQSENAVTSAKERVKSSLLYWVIGIAVAALITALVNFAFHIKEYKKLNGHHQASRISSDATSAGTHSHDGIEPHEHESTSR